MIFAVDLYIPPSIIKEVDNDPVAKEEWCCSAWVSASTIVGGRVSEIYCVNHIPSWKKLTYPLPAGTFESMIFLFSRWDSFPGVYKALWEFKVHVPPPKLPPQEIRPY